MWAWVLFGWIGLAMLLAVLHHRLQHLQPRLPAEVGEFLIRFETTLAQRHPEVGFLGLLRGHFAVLLRVRGQETPVSLQDAFRHCQAFPAAFEAMVDRLVHEIEEVGLDRVDDHPFAAVATAILPQIRSRQWLEEQDRFGESGFIHQLLTRDLAVVYVIDDARSMVFICRAHLRRWHKTEADIHGLALANLQRLGTVGLDHIDREPLLLRTGDGYDAARVLLLDQGSDGLLVAMPDRDVLWVAQEQGQNLDTLMAATERIVATAAHPVSAEVYRLRGGRLHPVSE